MPRKARELSALEVRRLIKPGRWSVGGVDGLALQVTASGARSWVLRIAITGKQREMGLGGFPSVTLADARERARTERANVVQGIDPIAQRQSALQAVSAERLARQTFSAAAEQYMALHAKGWKNPKHAAQWASTLSAYAYPLLGPLPVREINVGHIVAVLEPIWTSKTETASRVR